MDVFLKIESFVNAFFFGTRKRLRIGKRHYHENPCGNLAGLTEHQSRRVRELSRLYRIAFEAHLDHDNSLESYHLLDLLDRVRQRYAWPEINAQTLVDVGSKNFFYARALNTFFRPGNMTGIELDAYKLYHDLHTRWSYARFYIRDLPHAVYLAKDFLEYDEHADVVTLFLPFVVEYPLVKWTLPLKHFRPQKIFDHVFWVLKDDGHLLMTNQGEEEYQVASAHAQNSGLKRLGHFVFKQGFLDLPIPAHVSLWKK